MKFFTSYRNLKIRPSSKLIVSCGQKLGCNLEKGRGKNELNWLIVGGGKGKGGVGKWRCNFSILIRPDLIIFKILSSLNLLQVSFFRISLFEKIIIKTYNRDDFQYNYFFLRNTIMNLLMIKKAST